MSEKQDVITRIEEENKTETTVRSSGDPLKEDELEALEEKKFTTYDVASEWNRIMELYACQKILIPEKAQENLGLVVGINVSQEFPWKQIKFKYLANHLFESRPLAGGQEGWGITDLNSNIKIADSKD
uniref:Uncharacterized protein n=1 Tax=Megaselia scalaris TaxID=36166 RepID=T1H150_MEGSC